VTTRESNPDRLSRRIQGAEAIGLAAQAAREFGGSQWLDGDELARLCIIVEELVANLYEHGGLTADDQVDLGFSCEPDGIEVTIVDPGSPFDPWNAPRAGKRKDRGGGAGIDIVTAWAELVSYESTDAGNRLVFLLPVKWES
jgi:serine/threonine-protein kinase RsbW